MVPVLSIAIAFIPLRASRVLPPLKSIPSDEAFPIPAKNANGTLNTNAHGHEMTKNESAEYILSCHVMNPKRAGIVDTSNAQITTTGVYILENLVRNRTDCGLLAAACSTDSNTLDIIESFSSCVIFSTI